MVEDSFSLREIAGYNNVNGIEYDLESVARAVHKSQEWIKQGKMLGYVSHMCRKASLELDGHMFLPAKFTPACSTVALTLSGDVVTHRQAILDTKMGRAIALSEERLVGDWGWSWAASGKEGVVKSIYGFDYVQNPGFISLKLLAVMREFGMD